MAIILQDQSWLFTLMEIKQFQTQKVIYDAFYSLRLSLIEPLE